MYLANSEDLLTPVGRGNQLSPVCVAHTQILFIDFSSTFNPVNTVTLCNHLWDLQVNPSLILWIRDLLQDQPHHVVLNGFKSKDTILNTGVPPGCV